jgi:hypothetical protein
MYRPTNIIATADLVDGRYYRGTCRNTEVARWCQLTESIGKFLYVRRKFGETYVDEIFHPENEKKMDAFYPVEETTPTEEQQVSDAEMQRVKDRANQGQKPPEGAAE